MALETQTTSSSMMTSSITDCCGYTFTACMEGGTCVIAQVTSVQPVAAAGREQVAYVAQCEGLERDVCHPGWAILS